MHAVLVTFTIRPDRLDAFAALIGAQARTSLDREPGCLQFDVARQAADPTQVVLYEVYRDAAAFEAHLETRHFREFDRAVAPMVVAKTVTRLDRIFP